MSYKSNIRDKKSQKAKRIRRGMYQIEVGDLVKIKRPTFMVPKDTIALVMAIAPRGAYRRQPTAEGLPIGSSKRLEYIQKDLEVYKHACPTLRRATGG